MTTPIKTALIGAGFIGRVHAKNLSQNPDFDLAYVVDANEEVGKDIARLANVARARRELLQGNRLDHGCSPDGMKAQVRITRPTSPKGSLHSHSEIGVCPRDQAASAGRTDEAAETGTNRRVR